MAHGGRETEIKLAVKTAGVARAMLRRAGFRVSRRRAFEANTVFDTAARALQSTRRLLRVREAAGAVIITYKGPPEPGPHKSREEVETRVADAQASVAILQRLGFMPVFRYEKYRAEYRKSGAPGIATVDETPIGAYVELEGAPRWIDRTARALGYAAADYITSSYGSLYMDWCRRRGVKPSNMVFPRSPSAARGR